MDRREIVMKGRMPLGTDLAGYITVFGLTYAFWDIAETQHYGGKYEDIEMTVVRCCSFVRLRPSAAMRNFKWLTSPKIGAAVP